MSKSNSNVRRTALLVLGMHRSGTSALSGVLAKLGAESPKSLMPPTADNPKGYWESTAITDFNNAVLASAGSRWDEWEAFNEEWLRTSVGKTMMSEVPALLEQEFGHAPLFLLKDPRICRILPAWVHGLAAADVAVGIVIPVRNPIEVAQSLETRNKLTRLHALLIWLRHVLDAEHDSRGQRRVFVRYADLLADWRSEAARIAQALDIQWPRMSGRVEAEIDDYLDGTLKHHTAEQKLPTGNAILSWVAEAYAAHCDLADGRDAEAAKSRLDGVRNALEAVSRAFAPLFYEVRTDLARRLEARSEDVSRVSNEAKQLRTEVAELTQKQTHTETVVAKQKTDLETLTRELEVLKKEHDGRAAAMRDIEARHQSARDDLVAAKAEFAAVTSTLQIQLSASQRECADLRRQSEDMAGKLGAAEDRLRATVAEWERREKGLLDRLSAAESRTRDLITDRAGIEETHREQVASLNERLGEMIRDLEDRRTRAEAQAKERLSEVATLSKRVLELENAASAGQSELRVLQAELDNARAARRELEEEQDRRVRALVSELSAQSSVISGYRRTLDRIRDSKRWTYPGKLRQLARSSVGGDDVQRPVGEIEAMLRKSKLFDVEWYLTRNPDVRKRKVDPVRHYLTHGAKEGRDPGPAFSTKEYMARNPDVQAADINPLVHYLVYGRKEGRSIATADSRASGKL